MQKTFGLSTGLGLITLLSLQNAQAQDVKTVVAKTNAVYKQLKTLQATYETNIALGPQKGFIQTDAKILAGQKANVFVHTQGTNAAGSPPISGDQRIVDDGANLYVYSSQKNQYMKRPHDPRITLQMVASLYGLPYLSAPNTTMKLLPAVKLDGKSAYVVEITPNNSQGKGKILMMIDQATYHIKQNKLIVSAGAQSGTVTTTVKNESVNAPLSPAAFVFTPPKGATLVTPPPPPAGGMPGAPPNAPRPGGAPMAPPRPGGAPAAPPRPAGKP